MNKTLDILVNFPIESPTQTETMANTHHIPRLSQAEAEALPIKWVIKAWKNHNLDNFEYRLHQLLADGSIGINFGHYQELPPNVTDEHIMEAQRHIGHPENKKASRNMLRSFRNDLKIGDYVIIGQGGTKSRYVAQISSGYYYHPDETDQDWCMHRRRICNVRRLPEGFTRRFLMGTLGRYNPL